VSEITVIGFFYCLEKYKVFSNLNLDILIIVEVFTVIVEEEKKMNKNIIQIKGVTKAYKDVQVLKGVDLEVEQGGIFALLGSNGAGKTTMIRIMATLLKADAGSVVINGFDIEKDSSSIRCSISLTGQFAAIDEVLTGRENLQMIAKLRHLKNPKQVADELINRFGMSEAADRRVETYSGGMKRRIDIAMSLVGNPKIIFLDEPTTGLDPEARLEVWKIVKELSARGTTVFLTTQYLEEAEQLADKIAILHGGKIIAIDTLEGLKKLLPPTKVEYVEKQPTLEEIFLTIIGKKEEK
jgi:ABC-2 type transport system ATP-binding protein